MRHRAPRPYQTSILLAVIISLLGVSALYARPANRIDSTQVNPHDIVTPKFPFVVSNPSPLEPTSGCKQCHVILADEWTQSYHYLAWRDPVFQAFYGQYLDYLSPAGRPNALPASIYSHGGANNVVRNRRTGEVTDSSHAQVQLEDTNGKIENQADAAYQGKHPSRTLKESNSNYDQMLNDRLSVISPQKPIAVITHGDGLLTEGIINGKVQMNCLRCHAAQADITLDVNMELEDSTSGVSCDYCHTVVDRTDADGYILDPAQIKQGPYLTGLSSSHAIEFSRIQTKSEFCKSCHQKKNPMGVNVYNAYNEWFASPYAQAVSETTCQQCHMAPAPGKAALQGDDRDIVYSHKFQGAHDLAFLYQAATVKADVNVNGSNLLIDCTVTNDKAGHNFPADNPLRELVLIVRLKGPNGETLWQGKRVYSRVWGDADGNVTYNNWEATQVLADTSLRAREQRKESFQVPLPQVEGQMYVTAQLFYRALPEEGLPGIENVPAPFRVDHATAFLP